MSSEESVLAADPYLRSARVLAEQSGHGDRAKDLYEQVCMGEITIEAFFQELTFLISESGYLRTLARLRLEALT